MSHELPKPFSDRETSPELNDKIAFYVQIQNRCFMLLGSREAMKYEMIHYKEEQSACSVLQRLRAYQMLGFFLRPK